MRDPVTADDHRAAEIREVNKQFGAELAAARELVDGRDKREACQKAIAKMTAAMDDITAKYRKLATGEPA
jgi:hypothetical protein